MPGFIDSHCHPISGAMQEDRCRIQGILNWDTAKLIIQEYIIKSSFIAGDWIFVYGYCMSYMNYKISGELV